MNSVHNVMAILLYQIKKCSIKNRATITQETKKVWIGEI